MPVNGHTVNEGAPMAVTGNDDGSSDYFTSTHTERQADSQQTQMAPFTSTVKQTVWFNLPPARLPA